jgi:hypothetical protein
MYSEHGAGKERTRQRRGDALLFSQNALFDFRERLI